MIVLEVLGTPAPKGSGRAMLIGGKARFIASGTGANARTQRQWSKAVRQAALSQPHSFAATPLAVAIEFRMPRRKGDLGTGRNAGRIRPSAPIAPSGYPDIDKLTRCTLDALVPRRKAGKVVEYGIIDDDSRIVRLEVTKVYAAPGCEGARITVEVFTAESWGSAP
jgi:Holliday junction resolvase RusA-like endonuclease